MIKLCTKCNRQTEFEKMSEGNKFKCKSCEAIMYPCAGKECNYMISSWLYCDKCWNGGLKKFGLGVATIVLVPVAVAIALVGGGNKKG